MSGFLTNLLHKQRHPELWLRPRLGSRFERADPVMAGTGAEPAAEAIAPTPAVESVNPKEKPVDTHGRERSPATTAAPGAYPRVGTAQGERPRPSMGCDGGQTAAADGTAPEVVPLDRAPRTISVTPRETSSPPREAAPEPTPALKRIAAATDQPPALHPPTGAIPPPRTGKTELNLTPPNARPAAGSGPEGRVRPLTRSDDGVQNGAAQGGASGRQAPSPLPEATPDWRPRPAARSEAKAEPPPPDRRPAVSERQAAPPPPVTHDEPAADLPSTPARQPQRPPPAPPVSGRGEARSRSAAPGIRVSIGRIEVHARVAGQTEHRAGAPQAPSTKPTPFRPPLTLDGYLKKRSGGS